MTRRMVVGHVGPRRYRLLGSAGPVELVLARWRPRGEAVVGADRYLLRRTGLLDRGVRAVDAADGEVVLRLARRGTDLPGVPSATWRLRSRLRGHEATLRSPDVGSITFLLSPGRRAGVVAHLSGDWPNPDLLVLAGAFVLLLRRRDDAEAVAAPAPAVVAPG